jgi:integration host factor subunit beta
LGATIEAERTRLAQDGSSIGSFAGSVVIKSQLILRIAAQSPHLAQRRSRRLVDAVLDQIVAALAHGDRVELRRFGSFFVKVREGRVGRNPKTGATIHLPERKLPAFRQSIELRKRLNSVA